ncbi:MAG: DUF1294 domain-containing protein [Chthoniobacteraceae bacterium]
MSKTDLRERAPRPQRPDEAPRRRERDRPDRGSSRKRAISRGTAVSLLVLLVAPAAALYRLSYSIDGRILFGYWAAISALTYILYVRDKRKAERDEWRTPELDLPIGELLGGWAAAFFAQRVIRHKISKTTYQWTFWSIVFLHQFVAIDYLLGWSLSRSAVGMLRSLL